MEPVLPAKTAFYDFWSVGTCKCGGEVCFLVLGGDTLAGQRRCMQCHKEGADVILATEKK